MVIASSHICPAWKLRPAGFFKKQSGATKFNEEQMQWLRMIKDHIATNIHLEVDDLDYTPFDAEGGKGKMFQLFGDNMDEIINELNAVLAA